MNLFSVDLSGQMIKVIGLYIATNKVTMKTDHSYILDIAVL